MKSLDEQFIVGLLEHVGRAEVLSDVQVVYDDIERLIAEAAWSCRACGSCCHFAEFGHRLFITTPEIIYFLSALRDGRVDRAQAAAAIAAMGDAMEGRFCPLQAGRSCTVRSARPAGCRMFFCDPGDIEKSCQAYEIAHSRLKAICESRSVPYAYVEWTTALQTIPPTSL